tara:strand:- start:33382 stop:34593 length:1212 start_codon:yes stop_codon:yes gene_type:complete
MKNSLAIFGTYFLVLFSYPMVRSSVGALFYDHYSSKDYPFATFIAIIALIFIIQLSNAIQEIVGVRKLFAGICMLSSLLMLATHLALTPATKFLAYILFATKEIYIVLLIHLLLAFANNYYSLNEIKKLYGPLGAAGSIGGIVGGILTSSIATKYGTNVVLYVSLFSIMACFLPFLLVDKAAQTEQAKSEHHAEDNEGDTKPIQSIKGVTKYVLLIASIVAVTQWVIYIADLQFNIIFEKVVTEKNARTAYLGKIYTYINIATLFIQFVVLPLLLTRVKIKRIFYFIPVFYILLVFGGLGLGSGLLYVVAGVFISMKAVDYSLASVVKEVMYHPLSRLQKYGAKYITDMFVYRSSKAIIALVFSVWTVQNMLYLNLIQAVLVIIWLVCVYQLFKEQSLKFKQN